MSNFVSALGQLTYMFSEAMVQRGCCCAMFVGGIHFDAHELVLNIFLFPCP